MQDQLDEREWRVTFESCLVAYDLLAIDCSLAANQITFCESFRLATADKTSLQGGTVSISEVVAGRPSYTGSYSPRKTGNYSLFIYQLFQGGLRAQYFENPSFAGTPSLETIDPTVSFDWRDGEVVNYANDAVSARWNGKVFIERTEEYTFYAVADDFARVFVNHSLVVDGWEKCCGTFKGVIGLLGGQFYDVAVEYVEDTGSAFIDLQWSSTSMPRQTISPKACSTLNTSAGVRSVYLLRPVQQHTSTQVHVAKV